AADRRARKDLGFVVVLSVLHRQRPTGVTEDALADDGTQLGIVEARREIPGLLLGIPADRRLEQESVLDGEEGVAALTRTDDVVNLEALGGQHFPLGVQALLGVPESVPLTLDQEAQLQGLEGIVDLLIIAQ